MTMTTTTARPTRERITEVGLRMAELTAEIATRKAELDELKLEASTWPIDKYLAGDNVQLTVQAWRKRDDVAFEADHPFDAYPELYKFVLDTQAIDNEIAKVDLEPYMRQQTPKVLPKLIDAEAGVR